jgi:hypothetical protein
MPMHFPIEVLDHVDEWVAFSHDMKRVAGFGKSLMEADKMAEREGEENPVFFFVARHLLAAREADARS